MNEEIRIPLKEEETRVAITGMWWIDSGGNVGQVVGRLDPELWLLRTLKFNYSVFQTSALFELNLVQTLEQAEKYAIEFKRRNEMRFAKRPDTEPVQTP